MSAINYARALNAVGRILNADGRDYLDQQREVIDAARELRAAILITSAVEAKDLDKTVSRIVDVTIQAKLSRAPKVIPQNLREELRQLQRVYLLKAEEEEGKEKATIQNKARRRSMWQRLTAAVGLGIAVVNPAIPTDRKSVATHKPL